MLLKFSQGEELGNQRFRSHKMKKNSTHHFKSLDSWSIMLLRILFFFQLNNCSFFLHSLQRLGPDPWSWSAQYVTWSSYLDTANPVTPCTHQPSHQNVTLLLTHVFPSLPLWLWTGLTVASFILSFKKNTWFSLSRSLKLKTPSEVQLPWDVHIGRKSKFPTGWDSRSGWSLATLQLLQSHTRWASHIGMIYFRDSHHRTPHLSQKKIVKL